MVWRIGTAVVAGILAGCGLTREDGALRKLTGQDAPPTRDGANALSAPLDETEESRNDATGSEAPSPVAGAPTAIDSDRTVAEAIVNVQGTATFNGAAGSIANNGENAPDVAIAANSNTGTDAALSNNNGNGSDTSGVTNGSTGTSATSSQPSTVSVASLRNDCPALATVVASPAIGVGSVTELRAMTSGKHYKLTSDIDLTGNPWDPLMPLSSFVLDGDGHAISGLKIDDGAFLNIAPANYGMQIGLMRFLDCSVVVNLKVTAPVVSMPTQHPTAPMQVGTFVGGGTRIVLQNLAVENPNIAVAGNQTAGVIGTCVGCELRNLAVRDGSITNLAANNGQYTGGIFAAILNGTIHHVRNSASVSGGMPGGVGSQISGLVSVREAVNTGSITRSMYDRPHSGGVIGLVSLHRGSSIEIADVANFGQLLSAGNAIVGNVVVTSSEAQVALQRFFAGGPASSGQAKILTIVEQCATCRPSFTVGAGYWTGSTTSLGAPGWVADSVVDRGVDASALPDFVSTVGWDSSVWAYDSTLQGPSIAGPFAF